MKAKQSLDRMTRIGPAGRSNRRVFGALLVIGQLTYIWR
jgi:hypothetical protein